MEFFTLLATNNSKKKTYKASNLIQNFHSKIQITLYVNHKGLGLKFIVGKLIYPFFVRIHAHFAPMQLLLTSGYALLSRLLKKPLTRRFDTIPAFMKALKGQEIGLWRLCVYSTKVNSISPFATVHATSTRVCITTKSSHFQFTNSIKPLQSANQRA